MKSKDKDMKPKGIDKDKIASIVAAVLIVLFLGGSVFIGLAGSGFAGSKDSLVSDKELEKASMLTNSDDSEGSVAVLPMEEDFTITKNGVSAQSSAAKDSEAPSGDYILPDSDKRYLTDADVSGLSGQELKLARNEIIARHGRIFTNADVKEYFESKSWYHGTIAPETFDANINSYLSALELANIDMIKKYE